VNWRRLDLAISSRPVPAERFADMLLFRDHFAALLRKDWAAVEEAGHISIETLASFLKR
jgi:hypothetical protein